MDVVKRIKPKNSEDPVVKKNVSGSKLKLSLRKPTSPLQQSVVKKLAPVTDEMELPATPEDNSQDDELFEDKTDSELFDDENDGDDADDDDDSDDGDSDDDDVNGDAFSEENERNDVVIEPSKGVIIDNSLIQKPQPDFSSVEIREKHFLYDFFYQIFVPSSTFFINRETGEPYVTTISSEGYPLTFPLSSKSFNNHLHLELFIHCNSGCPDDSFAPHISTVTAYAERMKKIRKVNLRIGVNKNGTIFYDLNNNKRIFVKISSHGVSLISASMLNLNLPFIQKNSMAPQVLPSLQTTDRNLVEMLKPFFNLKHQSQLVLLAITIVTWFFPNIAKPIILFTGEPGAGKTLACTLVNRIVDPCSHANFNLKKKISDMAPIFANHYVSLIDNVSTISDDVSDFLATAVTKSSIGSRQLYTNGELNIISFDHCAILLAGVHNFVAREDLMTRIIHFPLEIASPRIPESEILRTFENALPDILHEIFQILAHVLNLKEDIEDKKANTEDPGFLPYVGRLVDYEETGQLVGRVLFNKNGDQIFSDEYAKTMHRQTFELLLKDITIRCTYEYLESRHLRKGKTIDYAPERLYDIVQKFGRDQGLLQVADLNFASSPAVFGKKVSGNKEPNKTFKQLGYEIISKSGAIRKMYITKL